MEKAPTYALLFAFAFLIAGLFLAVSNPCIGLSGLQACAPVYQPTGDVLVAFGGLFLVLWVVLIAMEEMHRK